MNEPRFHIPRSLSTVLLALWLIGTGAIVLFRLTVEPGIMGFLAVAAGFLMLIGW